MISFSNRYMGHGNGREFLKGDEITRLYCQAVALIMGCSSGKLIVSALYIQHILAFIYIVCQDDDLHGSPANFKATK
jgi:hypothetical protein